MNAKIISFLKNCIYSIASNFVSLIISVVVVFIVPKRIGVEQYGYWQLYLFYISYVGLFHFGWIEGFYLKYGGKSYADLDKPSFSTQFWILNLIESMFSVLLAIYVSFFIEDQNRKNIMYMVILNIIVVMAKTFLTYVLLSVNHIRQYAVLTLFERLISFGIILIILFKGIQKYQLLLLADIAAKLGALGLVGYYCREIVFGRTAPIKTVFPEIKESIIIGSKILFANIAGMLILGIVRFGIEYQWGVATFGKVSMALGVSNLYMIFINALNIIVFPLLKNTESFRLPEIYKSFRSLLMTAALGLLLLYYPGERLLSYWLPAYQESFVYMALLFPLCVYESKWSLLIYTYLKILRKEKWIFYVNAFTVFLSFLFTGITVFLWKNLIAAISCILILLAMRCMVAELLVLKILNIWIGKTILLEGVMSLTFVLTAWFLQKDYAFACYLGACFFYSYQQKNQLPQTVKKIREFIHKI